MSCLFPHIWPTKPCIFQSALASSGSSGRGSRTMLQSSLDGSLARQTRPDRRISQHIRRNPGAHWYSGRSWQRIQSRIASTRQASGRSSRGASFSTSQHLQLAPCAWRSRLRHCSLSQTPGRKDCGIVGPIGLGVSHICICASCWAAISDRRRF